LSAQRYVPAVLHPGNIPIAKLIAGYVGPSAGLDGSGNRPAPGFDLRTFQPTACQCTDWAISAHWDINGFM